MKKVLFSILLIGAGTFAHAQKSEVAAAKKEWGMFQLLGSNQPIEKSLESLNGGLKRTDAAITHEKTKDLPETWSYRALFASAIAVTDTVNIQNSIEKQKIAEEAIAKTKQLDTKGDEKDNLATAELNVNNALKVRAFAAYNKQDFESALKYFNEVTARNPNDTAMYLNAGIMARNLKNYPETIRNFKKVISLNSPNAKDLYLEVINLNLAEVKDTVAAMETIKEASAKFPDEMSFIQSEADLYIKKGDIAKSEEMLDKLIAKDPNNSVYQYLKGDVYYLQAVELQGKKNKLDPKNVKEANAISTQMAGLLDKALPFYLKAAELDPKSAAALEAQKRIYAFKNDTANYDKVSAKLKELNP
ncbi:tetratricopeptide repeat protein [Pedobacter sp.]|uniref:tetratricopeptide repeat protein n=1 Tax=Pedobacter sp. TaxID=1411316 RepID=UPI003D7F62C7